MGARILIVEDDEATAQLLSESLESAAERFDVTAVASAHDAYACLANHDVDCVLLDYRLQDADGLKCLATIQQRHPGLPVIFITGMGSEEVAVEAMKIGASHYIAKHGRYLTMLPAAIREALGRRAMRQGAEERREALRSPAGEPARRVELLEAYRLLGIIGGSPELEDAVVAAEAVAQSTAPVLLTGETGTGKERFARAIHLRGPRARGPFVPVNCAGLPEGLLESEVFGHMRGAFTGAERRHHGLFEQAEGGTLFLDEVSEMSPGAQAKLLRVLQDGEVRPVGGSGSRRVDVRLIAASNGNLREAVEEKHFRADLFYRLSVFPIHLPSLRERRGDVRALALHFLREFAEKEGKASLKLDPRAMPLLEGYPWPGNVRELQGEMRRLVICARAGERLGPDALEARILDSAAAACRKDLRPLKEIIRQVEVSVILARLRFFAYHRGATARSLGVTREWLWAKMRHLGIEVPLHRSTLGNGQPPAPAPEAEAPDAVP